MAIYRVVWSDYAAIKKINIGLYILERLSNRIAAARIVKAIGDAADDLSSMPQRFRVVDQRMGLRRRNVKNTNYFILYTIDERQRIITIMYVFHNKQDWRNQLETPK